GCDRAPDRGRDLAATGRRTAAGIWLRPGSDRGRDLAAPGLGPRPDPGLGSHGRAALLHALHGHDGRAAAGPGVRQSRLVRGADDVGVLVLVLQQLLTELGRDLLLGLPGPHVHEVGGLLAVEIGERRILHGPRVAERVALG